MSSSSTPDEMIFGAYIGALYRNVRFSEVPINPKVQFDFHLSFALDYTNEKSSPTPTNGKFNVFWDHYTLTPDEVASVKRKHSKVRVGVSLGGDSVHGKPVIFKPDTIESWVSNAVSSLDAIIRKYNLDGIDINYEHFTDNDESTFVDCIGRLIETLKGSGLLKFVSISPFAYDVAERRYHALWNSRYRNMIDYVNYQFYSYDNMVQNGEQLIGYFELQKRNYCGGKILASYVSDGTRGLPPGEEFLNACNSLKERQLLSGIFVWCADISRRFQFRHETEAQALLAAP